jgi:hypothetical protein
MSQSVFKGAIKAGRVSSTFQSDFSNIDPDVLIQSYAQIPSGATAVDRKVISPGGADTAQFNAPKPGVLEIFVATGHQEESGRLVVRAGNKTMHDEPIQGPVRWVYSVE